jgi:hypothetical protein
MFTITSWPINQSILLKPGILYFCLMFFSGFIYAAETVQVINIHADHRLEIISPLGKRQLVQIAGIKPFNSDMGTSRIFKQRLKTLILGKTIQLIPLIPGVAQVHYSGIDVAERLLYEGAAELDQTTLQGISMNEQQKYISAAESAFQSGRGIWQQNPSYGKRFHQPIWPANQLPQPMTSAPIFRP